MTARRCRDCGRVHECDAPIRACICICGSTEVETFWPDPDERVRVRAFSEREGVSCG
jgi:hypothetical protein